MKLTKITKVLLTLGLCLSVVAQANFPAGDGNSVDNGGEYLALEFTRTGYQILSAMKKLPPEEQVLSAAQLEELETVIAKIRVDAVPGPLFDNSEKAVDARFNKPTGTIEIDSSHWPLLLAERPEAYRLVAHEYFRALGLNDDNYVISAKLDLGLASEILGGQLRLTANGVVSQSRFAQLGDYFFTATVPVAEDFLAKNHWQGACFTAENDAYINTPMEISANDLDGPLFPGQSFAATVGSELGFESGQFKVADGSLEVRSNRSGTQQVVLSFRKMNDYLLATVDQTWPEYPSQPRETSQRCYFW